MIPTEDRCPAPPNCFELYLPFVSSFKRKTCSTLVPTSDSSSPSYQSKQTFVPKSFPGGVPELFHPVQRTTDSTTSYLLATAVCRGEECVLTRDTCSSHTSRGSRCWVGAVHGPGVGPLCVSPAFFSSPLRSHFGAL